MLFCPALSVCLHFLLPFQPWRFLLLSHPPQNEGFNGLLCFYLHILLSWPPQATIVRKYLPAPFGGVSKGWGSLYSSAACSSAAFSLPAARAVAARSTWADLGSPVTESGTCDVLSLPGSEWAALVHQCHLLTEPRTASVASLPLLEPKGHSAFGDRQGSRAGSFQPHELLSEPILSWAVCLAGIWAPEELLRSALPLMQCWSSLWMVGFSVPAQTAPIKNPPLNSSLLHFLGVSVNVKTPLEWTELGQNEEGMIPLPA